MIAELVASTVRPMVHDLRAMLDAIGYVTRHGIRMRLGRRRGWTPKVGGWCGLIVCFRWGGWCGRGGAIGAHDRLGLLRSDEVGQDVDRNRQEESGSEERPFADALTAGVGLGVSEDDGLDGFGFGAVHVDEGALVFGFGDELAVGGLLSGKFLPEFFYEGGGFSERVVGMVERVRYALDTAFEQLSPIGRGGRVATCYSPPLDNDGKNGKTDDDRPNDGGVQVQRDGIDREVAEEPKDGGRDYK
ncbi:hypothetical protein [Nonomuraea sp. H19]|uniref:hypothetical protein n=1 Tax=Nonomuraea sp. H19 TaxID=3452206 RepID=UPI003F8BBDFF